MKKRYFTYWLASAVSGLVLTGFGLSLLGEAIGAKRDKKPWFWVGTLSLVVFNSGLSLVGTSVIHRFRWLLEKEKGESN